MSPGAIRGQLFGLFHRGVDSGRISPWSSRANNCSGYLSWDLIRPDRLDRERGDWDDLDDPEPDPEQLIGLISPATPIRPDPGQKTPIPKTPQIAPYSNPNKFGHPEPE